MEATHPEQVRVELGDEIVEITWAEREALLERLRDIHGRETIIARFNAVVEHRTVVLDHDDSALVRVVLQTWNQEGGLPNGLADLLHAFERAEAGGSGGTPSDA